MPSSPSFSFSSTSSSTKTPQISCEELIAETALHHFNQLPSGRGKPQPTKEWTVYAALVATRHSTSLSFLEKQSKETSPSPPHGHENVWVVACATGTKCTCLNAALSHLPSEEGESASTDTIGSTSTTTNAITMKNRRHSNKGRILKDSHAEVLVRRGLMRVLWKEIIHFLTQYNHCRGNGNAQMILHTMMKEKKNTASHDDDDFQTGAHQEESFLVDDAITATKTDQSSSGLFPISSQYESNTSSPSSSKHHQHHDNSKQLLSIHISTIENGPSMIHFELQSNIQLHLYISDSPCGDASIYELDSKYNYNPMTSSSSEDKNHDDRHTSGSNEDKSCPTIHSHSPLENIHKGAKESDEGRAIPNAGTFSHTAAIPTLNYTGAKIILSHSDHHSSTKNTKNNTCKSHHRQDDSSLFTLIPPLMSHFPPTTATATTTTTTFELSTNHSMDPKDMTHPDYTLSKTASSTSATTQIAREIHTQVLSALRLKSSRSNISHEFRTQSLSCSDKIVRWIALGLQGSGPLTSFIPNPIRLSSIVVSQDPRCCFNSTTATITPSPTTTITTATTPPITSTTNIPTATSENTNTISTSSMKWGSHTNMSQLDALKRAIYDRAYLTLSMIHSTSSTSLRNEYRTKQEDLNTLLPNIYISSSTFACSKAIHDKIKIEYMNHDIQDREHNFNKKRQKIDTSTASSSSPCGVCLNWQQEESSSSSSYNYHSNNKNMVKIKLPATHDKKAVEVIVGAKGIVQGIHPKTIQDVKRFTSRLSREIFRENIIHAIDALALSQLQLNSVVSIPKGYSSLSYQQLKQSFSLKEARDFRQQVLLNHNNDGPLGGWLITDQEGDFFG